MNWYGIAIAEKIKEYQILLNKTLNESLNKKVVKSMKFVVFKDKQGLYRFRFVARNGKIVCQSESYPRKRACLDGIKALKKCSKAKIVEAEMGW